MNVEDEVKKLQSDLALLNKRIMTLAQSAGAHNLLSSVHPDTLPAAVQQGDIIRANATPKWARLAKGNDGDYFQMVAGVPVWAPLSAAVGEEDIAFIDRFDDASIFWAWDVFEVPPGRYIGEAGGVLTIGGQNAVQAIFSTSGLTAPRIRTGVPGYPLIFQVKIVDWLGTDDSQAALWITFQNTASSSWIYGRVRDDGPGYNGLAVYQCNAADPGTMRSYLAVTTLPIWIRMRWNSGAQPGLTQLFFDYSTDGVTFINQYQITSSFTHTYPTDAIGMMSRNFEPTRNQHWAEFDDFKAWRSFGPG